MDRRGFLSAAAVVAGGVLVGDAAVAAAPRRPVAAWEELGGFVPAGYLALRPPKLVVYGDGLVIADAARYARLRSGRLDQFLDLAVEVLSNRANGVRRPGAPIVADVPTTKFTARRRGRTWSIEAEALEVLREHRAYPRPLYELLDRFTDHRNRTLRAGDPYAPAAVRLVTVRVEQPPPTRIAPWPADVPVLVPTRDTVSRSVDLRGRTARAVMRGIAHGDAWSFTTYRTGDGTYLAAAWRHLLPHE